MPISVVTFAGHLPSSASRVEQVLRSHLWIESMVSNVIETWCVNPEALNLGRMSFAGKVDLAYALGGIDSESRAWFRAVNKIRNRLAHELDGEPTDEEIAELARTVNGSVGDIVEGVLKLTDPTATSDGRSRFRTAVLVQLLHMEFRRMHEEWRRRHQPQLIAYRVERALLRAGGTDISSDQDAELRERYGIEPEPRPRDALVAPPGVDMAAALEEFAHDHSETEE